MRFGTTGSLAIIGAVAQLSAASPAHAQEDRANRDLALAEAVACLQVDRAIERLDCYDAAIGKLVPAASTRGTAPLTPAPLTPAPLAAAPLAAAPPAEAGAGVATKRVARADPPVAPLSPTAQSDSIQTTSETTRKTPWWRGFRPKRDGKDGEASNAAASTGIAVEKVDVTAFGRTIVHLSNGDKWVQVDGDETRITPPPNRRLTAKIERTISGNSIITLIELRRSFIARKQT